jgi:hypothetical protein
LKTLGEILAEASTRTYKPVVRNEGPMVTEIPQYDCWTRTFNLSMVRYAKEPSVDQTGKVLTFWEAHPEHWRYRVLEGRVCSAQVNRMCVCCDDCGRIVVRFEKAYWAERRAKKVGDAG